MENKDLSFESSISYANVLAGAIRILTGDVIRCRNCKKTKPKQDHLADDNECKECARTGGMEGLSGVMRGLKKAADIALKNITPHNDADRLYQKILDLHDKYMQLAGDELTELENDLSHNDKHGTDKEGPDYV